MTTQEQISEAERQHKPRLHLVRKLVAEKAEQLAYENKLGVSTEDNMTALTVSVSNLCRIATQDAAGFAIVREQLTDLGITRNRLGLLISALQAQPSKE